MMRPISSKMRFPFFAGIRLFGVGHQFAIVTTHPGLGQSTQEMMTITEIQLSIFNKIQGISDSSIVPGIDTQKTHGPGGLI